MEDMIKIDENMSYEKAIEELKTVVRKLSEGNCTLDESLKYFKYGTSLVEFCNKKLNEVKQQIELVNPATGETAPSEF